MAEWRAARLREELPRAREAPRGSSASEADVVSPRTSHNGIAATVRSAIACGFECHLGWDKPSTRSAARSTVGMPAWITRASACTVGGGRNAGEAPRDVQVVVARR